MEEKGFLSQFYTIDRFTGNYVIEIALRNYNEIFNIWDSSTTKLKGLDPSFKTFLEECSSNIDMRQKVALRFIVQEQKKDLKLEEKIKKGIHNYFVYSLFTINNKLAIRRKKIIYYIFLSSIFVTFYFYFQNVQTTDILKEIVLYSLTIGGWVFLWESFSLLFIQGNEMKKKKIQYKRLLNASIVFRYQ